jgi:probable HAF family extracellular repeat protein
MKSYRLPHPFYRLIINVRARMLVITVAISIAPFAQAAAYNVFDLGALKTSFESSGSGAYNALSNTGFVVGSTRDTRGDYHAFRTTTNVAITPQSDLQTIFATSSSASSVNDSGQAVGSSMFDNGSNSQHAFRTQPNGQILAASDLGTLPGGLSSSAWGINASGQTVGVSYTVAGAVRHAFRTAPNGLITPASDLNGLGVSESIAYAINASGQTVGFAGFAGFDHAFRTAPNGQVTPDSDLGTLGGAYSEAHSINDSGVTVGHSFTVASGSHAFRTIPNGVIDPASDLGTLGGNVSIAYGVNNSNQTVGSSFASSGFTGYHAFFVDVTGPMQDLNDLIPAGSGWQLQEAHGINDIGQIAGFGTIGGHTHAFVLTPTPEPASASFLALPALLLLARKRRLNR